MSEENLNSYDFEELEREQNELDKRIASSEAQGLADVYKYFDRINDKLSSFNNMLVAGYFALAAFSIEVSKWILIIPLVNMSILIFVDYKMMEQGRFLSQISCKPLDEISKYGRRQNQVTLWSLFTIITTLLTTVYLLLISNEVIIPKAVTTGN